MVAAADGEVAAEVGPVVSNVLRMIARAGGARSHVAATVKRRAVKIVNPGGKPDGGAWRGPGSPHWRALFADVVDRRKPSKKPRGSVWGRRSKRFPRGRR